MELLREARIEVCLRLCAVLVLVLTASLVAFDSQTKVIIYTIEKKATYQDIQALQILVYVASAAAGYNLIQLCKHFVSAFFSTPKTRAYFVYMAWFCFLCDQVAMYLTMSANAAALEGSMFAVTGVKAFQWMKLCNKFRRFCLQIGGSVLCGYVASILMAIISSLSAYNLFRFYSPTSFFSLKPFPSSINSSS